MFGLQTRQRPAVRSGSLALFAKFAQALQVALRPVAKLTSKLRIATAAATTLRDISFPFINHAGEWNCAERFKRLNDRGVSGI